MVTTMIQSILNFFGFGKKEETTQPLTEGSTATRVKTQTSNSIPSRPPAPARPPIKKTSIRTKNYYRRNGNYYSSSDDSLIEDLMLLVVLDELFNDGDIREYVSGNFTAPEPEVASDDLLDIDVSETPVVEAEEINWSVDVPADDTPPPATYTPDPEPVRESYSAGSSDYDSGSSDSGGSDD